MKTKKGLFTTIVLSIFVLTHILPLYNAISDCADIEGYETVEDYDDLYKDRLKELSDAQDALTKAENNNLFSHWIETTVVTTITGTVAGTLGALATMNPLPLQIGIIGGIASGTIASIATHYKAIKAAREAVKTAEKRVIHAKAKLVAAKQQESEETIIPRERYINIDHTPTHHIDISSSTWAIREVSVAFMPTDRYSTRPIINTSKTIENVTTTSTTLSYTFTEDQTGPYSAQVTVTLINGYHIYRQYGHHRR